ncbi:MAG: hypothetical protein LBH44_14450 [Treponema sp.]|jgi:hypothetical protein|nr:hypothetical protein [Treponema sp.]
MTLTGRNIFFKAGIGFCAVFLFIAVVASSIVMPVYSMMDEDTPRPTGVFQVFVSRLLENNYFSVHTSVILAVLFSLIGTILIYYFFEQTLAHEILYVYLFTLSFSIEASRLIVPLHLIYDVPPLYLLMASRVLLFGRYFGIFALFAASVCAAGLKIQQTRNPMLIITAAALIITLGVPIDTQTWDTSLNMIVGYTSMFRFIEAVILVTSVISFMVASYTRSSREYIFIGLGALFVMIGRNILLDGDNWSSPVPGILLLAAGTWFICSRLHKINLWL